MMEWVDEGIILSVRRHGESSAVVDLLTRDQGRHAGLVKGALSKQTRGLYQPGNLVKASWRARLAEHLGLMQCELIHDHAGAVLADPGRLLCLSSACALTEAVLPERETHRAAFDGLLALLASMEEESWATLYVHWELGLLRELGFALDLERCAATGSRENLTYVSPKSGRAVSDEAAGPYRERLLRLPAFLRDGGEGSAEEVFDGLVMTGYFLERHVLGQNPQKIPAARIRMVDRMRAQATISAKSE